MIDLSRHTYTGVDVYLGMSIGLVMEIHRETSELIRDEANRQKEAMNRK